MSQVYTNPSLLKGADLPVEYVSWDDCQEFIRKLNLLTDGNYRLPTVDEWEYACRAGSCGEYGNLAGGAEGTLDEMGWYKDNSGRGTHPVGQKKANAFGLYDMHGNVWEWTSTAVGDQRVYCGGGWYSSASYCGCGYRSWHDPGRRDNNLGFRLACGRAAKP